MWRLGVLQSAASMVYFGANTFIPDYLHATSQADLVGLALTSLNGAQVPASAVIGLVPLRVLARPMTSYAVAGAILVSLGVVLTLPGAPLIAAAGVFGFCAAYILVLSFALPALLAEPADVARLSAGTFAISYSTAFLVTLLATWMMLVFVGYSLLLLPWSGPSLTEAMRLSGSSMFTLGFVVPQDAAPTVLVFLAAASGLVIVALLIAYLPALYSAFNRRETLVTMLDARGGSPAWGPEVLARQELVDVVDSLGQFYERWQEWAADRWPSFA